MVSRPMRGFSLVELMVALVLGLVLIAGVTQVFLGNRQTQTTEQGLAQVQESGRLALNFLESDLRLVGFYGTGAPSNSSEDASVTNQVTSGIYDHFDNFDANAIRVFAKSASGTWSPATPPSDVPASVATAARNGSDLIVVYSAYDTGGKIPAGVEISTTENVTVENVHDCFSQNDLALLATVAGAVIFQVTNSPTCTDGEQTLEHSTTSNTTASFSPFTFNNKNSRLLKLRHRIYYVADTGRDNSAGQPVFSLYRVTNGGTPQELVEGVEFLRLNYGERLASGNVRYGDASVVSSDGITSARVGVMVQSLDPSRTDNDTRTYGLLDLSINADGTGVDHGGDRRLRRVFTSNVELRNRAE